MSARPALPTPHPALLAAAGLAAVGMAWLGYAPDSPLSGDQRDFPGGVAIGMAMPWAAVEILRQRLTRAAFDRATYLAEVFPQPRRVIFREVAHERGSIPPRQRGVGVGIQRRGGLAKASALHVNAHRWAQRPAAPGSGS